VIGLFFRPHRNGAVRRMVALAQIFLANPVARQSQLPAPLVNTALTHLSWPAPRPPPRSGHWLLARSGERQHCSASLGLNNFFSSIAETGHSYNGCRRVDYEISNKHHLYLRGYIGQGNQTAPLGGSPALGTASSNLQDYFEVAPLHVGNYSACLIPPLARR